jgi:hypothetical protein
MYNRKFNIKKDFSKLNELENTIMPIIRSMKNEEEKEILENFVRKTFDNQFKK